MFRVSLIRAHIPQIGACLLDTGYEGLLAFADPHTRIIVLGIDISISYHNEQAACFLPFCWAYQDLPGCQPES
jgi:hypothetical protein